ncbi:inter-alpha-trypsin inhibitor heavy chain H3-like isoform X2 [Dreissena polymorpha]|uniref:inter-alpha-trypsin inhibitor heavy chain H3-like isoform X2 n=1 Tax=Dreissena polymorpha TaxID=45954 RepID=UPI0022642D6C|nr:inter-alpha-trypsin inhibitor heavy chain H3-like isoform X2 [Dreissena polymorpha]
MASNNGRVLLAIFAIGIKLSVGVELEKPEITFLHIDSDVKYRFATTKVSSRLKNRLDQTTEALIDVTLPNEAFITNLTLEIDGRIVVGQIKEKEVAKQEYEQAKAQGQSAGYIGTKSRETNRFQLAVSVAPLGKISFNLTYQELLKRKHGHYEHVVYIDPGQVVVDMVVRVAIMESRNITKLRIPSLRNDIEANLTDLSTVTLINRPTPKEALVQFVPSLDFQTMQSESGMAGQFVLQYDVERSMDAGDLLLVNGYFVHFFAPEGLQPVSNDVLFILDVSGSMRGTKMTQLKEAMKSILGQLHGGDSFNIVTFSDKFKVWENKMVDIDDEDVKERALAYVNNLTSDGSTNIEMALRKGIELLKPNGTSGRESKNPVVVFLTDGEATAGVIVQANILANIQKTNEGKIPIFCLAFGDRADYTLTKKLAAQNNGIGRKIYEASDAAMQIAGFYNEIAVTLLSNVTFQYLDAPTQKLTQTHYMNYFNGSEIVNCGWYEGSSIAHELATLRMRVNGNTAKKSNENLDISLSDIVIVTENDFENSVENMTHVGVYEQITEKIWAYLTIKQLLQKEVAAIDTEKSDALKKQIIGMSLKYGFVTPHTSMVVTELKRRSGIQETKEHRHVVGRQYSRSGNMAGRLSMPSMVDPMSSSFLSSSVRSPHRRLGMPSLYDSYIQPSWDDPELRFTRTQLPPMHHVTPSPPGYITKPEPPKAPNKRRRNKKRGGTRKGNSDKYPHLIMRKSNLALCKDLDSKQKEVLLYGDRAKDLSFTAFLENNLIRKVILQHGRANVTIVKDNVEHQVIFLDEPVPWNITKSGKKRKMRVDLDAFSILISKTTSMTVRRSERNKPLTNIGEIGKILSDTWKVEINPANSKLGTLITSSGRQPVELVPADKKAAECWKGDF